MTVNVDPDWLTEADRVFPVTIDPTLMSPASTTFIQSGLGSQYGLPTVSLGSTDGGVTVARSLLRFNGSFADMTVSSATLRLTRSSGTSCMNVPMNIYRLVGPFGPSTTWANPAPLDSTAVTSTGTSGCGNNLSLNVTPIVQAWAAGAANYGLQVQFASDSRPQSSFYATATNGPRLEVTLSNVANTTPSQPEMNPRQSTTTPVLRSEMFSNTTSSPPVEYWYRVTTGADAESGSVVDSGWINADVPSGLFQSSWQVPAGALRDGGVDYWHTWAIVNGVRLRPDWVRSFKVDLGLGDEPTAAFDDVGPARVNLVNGNLSLRTGSLSFPAVGGSAGFTYTYNSQTPLAAGLIGSYYADSNGNHAIDTDETALMQRLDPQIQFDWQPATTPPFPPTT